MPRFGKERHHRLLRVTVDERDPGHAELLALIDQIREDYAREHGIELTESKAMLHLMFLGKSVFFQRALSDARRQLTSLRKNEYPKRSKGRLRASKPAAQKRHKERAAQDACATEAEVSRPSSAPVRVAPQPPVAPVSTPVQTAPVSLVRPEPTAAQVPATEQRTAVDLLPARAEVGPKPGSGLMRLRSMALSQSVVPPEALAPRLENVPVEGLVSPAAAASALAKMKVDGREF